MFKLGGENGDLFPKPAHKSYLFLLALIIAPLELLQTSRKLFFGFTTFLTSDVLMGVTLSPFGFLLIMFALIKVPKGCLLALF
jgi:hypothetical protein